MRDELDIPMPSTGGSFRIPRRRAAMDANTRRLLLAAGAIGATLVVLMGAWALTGSRGSGQLPVVEAANTPVKSKPADPGGMTVAGKDASILSDRPDSQAVLAPPPEAPAIAKLREQAAREEAERKAAAEKLAAEKQAAAEKLAAQKQAAAQKLADERLADEKPVGQKLASAPPAKLAAEAPKPAAPPPAPPSSPRAEQVALAIPLPPAPPPAPQRAGMVEAAARVAPPAAAPASAAHGSAAQGSAAQGSAATVQLAALGSEAAALEEWRRLEQRMPGLLRGHRPAVMKVARDGRVFYRLRTGGFASNGDAGRFCGEVKAQGGSCTVAAF